MIKSSEYYMSIALEEANKALIKGEIPVGCVIVSNDQVIAKSHNLKETLNLATAHAEVLAIETASKALNSWRLKGCTLYVTLEPCPMCAGAIIHSRVDKVVIGALDNKDGAVISSKHIFENNHNHKLIVETKVLEKQCNNILIDFLNSKRK